MNWEVELDEVELAFPLCKGDSGKGMGMIEMYIRSDREEG